MYDRARRLVLHWLKVPAEPHPPAGDPASLRVFRAGKNYFRLRLLGWLIPQLLALGGIIFWTVVVIQVEDAARAGRAARAAAPAPVPVPPVVQPPSAPATPAAKRAERGARNRNRLRDWDSFKQYLTEVAVLLPPWSFPLIWAFKIAGILLYLAQIPFTYAVRRLDFELRWYIVTDRSLRIRTGVWNVQELTMSFANLQQVVVTQGPVQGLLGLADVRVQSAGGGGGGAQGAQKHQDDSLHTAVFHSVDNAPEIRDLILDRLRKFRATGLGDPDDHRDHPAPAAPPA
ncbi:MAG: PH domain-containing protein, partial [Verrucomicrobia bacterium]|nr:PH domain-containing protein [Verrucomicrobiota bacterium]